MTHIRDKRRRYEQAYGVAYNPRRRRYRARDYVLFALGAALYATLWALVLFV